jgi:anti-sigma factor RsiW
VTHPNFAAQLDAYLDGELAADDARELETHLGQCSECTRFRDGRLALRAAVVAGVPTFQAPAALRERIREAARGAAPTARAPRRFTARNVWRPLALAASLAVVALGSWTLALQRAAGEALADDVLASHIRSLMPPPGHLTDVPSSDQHTVKPWFNGRLDFSPPVYDFAGRGYPLVGGRLDYVGGRPVGALVYGRRQHLINVFIWPATRGPSGGPSMRTRQGYHELHWTTGDYTYWVVSDLGLAELQDFAQLLRQA